MFVNASPCPYCFEASKGFAGKYNVTFNVKYSSFHHKSNKEDFDMINKNSSSNLKIFLFNTEDFKYWINGMENGTGTY